MPLTVWFVAALACLPDYSFDTVQAWAAAPWRAFLLSVLVFCMAWHSQLGVQVVIEDYVHGTACQAAGAGAERIPRTWCWARPACSPRSASAFKG